jgi:hypothetical protein
MQPTEEQIISIAGYADTGRTPSYIGEHAMFYTKLFTTNLTELNKVWAKVCREMTSIWLSTEDFNDAKHMEISIRYQQAINTNNIPAACIAVAEGIELLNKLKK